MTATSPDQLFSAEFPSSDQSLRTFQLRVIVRLEAFGRLSPCESCQLEEPGEQEPCSPAVRVSITTRGLRANALPSDFRLAGSAVLGSVPPLMQVRLVSFPTCIKEPNTKPARSRRDRGLPRHLPSLPLSFSFSPPLCHLWQHLLPLLLFPIVQWACPLSCPPFSLF